jgi:hypothetical protein
MRDSLVDIQDVDRVSGKRLRERGGDAGMIRTVDVQEEYFAHGDDWQERVFAGF